MKWLDKILGIKKRCFRCGSSKVKLMSQLNGGWNYLCEQSVARTGWQCNNCLKIEWEQSDDDFEKTLPNWCKSDRQIKIEKEVVLNTTEPIHPLKGPVGLNGLTCEIGNDENIG